MGNRGKDTGCRMQDAGYRGREKGKGGRTLKSRDVEESER